MTLDKIVKAVKESKAGLDKVLNSKDTLNNIEKASILISKTLQTNSQIFACGNGGSMCDAMHFAEELSGRFRQDRKGLSAISISDPSFITCVANDYGFQFVFSRFMESNSKKNDLLVAISTSGKSENILNACKYCKTNKVKIITITGKENSEISKYADIDICTPNGKYSDRVQEIHTLVIHILVELVEGIVL